MPLGAWVLDTESGTLSRLPVPPGGAPAGASAVDYLQPGGIYRDATLRVVPEVFLSDVFVRPVNVLSHAGQRYLVAPRGQTQWVRNLRAAGGGELRVGRKVERFTATELPDERKPEVLRAYLGTTTTEDAA